MICRPGMSSISRPSGGWLLAALRLSSMICGCSCEKRKGATDNPRQPFLTVEPCNRLLKVEGVQATTGQNDAKAARVHAAVDTLGNLLALLVTPANEQDRAQVGELAQAVQEATGQSVELAF